jgi:hypothetical protein
LGDGVDAAEGGRRWGGEQGRGEEDTAGEEHGREGSGS